MPGLPVSSATKPGSPQSGCNQSVTGSGLTCSGCPTAATAPATGVVTPGRCCQRGVCVPQHRHLQEHQDTTRDHGQGQQQQGLENKRRSCGAQPVSHRLGPDIQWVPPQHRQHMLFVLSPPTLEKYEDMAKKVDYFVDLTGRGRRTDGTRAPDLLAIGWRSVCSRFAASVCQCYHCHG